MMRARKESLRQLTEDEHQVVERVAHSGSERADRVLKAKELLAVMEGYTYRESAHQAGCRSRNSVSHLVVRFNREGVSALDRRTGEGRKPRYNAAARARILAEVRRKPQPEEDGTATWSLMTLRRALRTAPDGLPNVSTYTIWKVLRESDFRYLAARSWCDTGRVVRQRKEGVVTVTDADADGKKNPD
jgi:transposase